MLTASAWHKGHKDRVFGLDVLRATAIIFVMWSHGHIYSKQLLDVQYYRWLMWDGVGLFFVLSGFLIGQILINIVLQNEFNFKTLMHFWWRRWFRTLPLYYLVLTVLVLLYFVAHKCLPPNVIAFYTFTQCFAWPHPLFFGEAWSLAVEEWFYILLPVALFLVFRFRGDKKKQLALVIFALCLLGTIIRTYKAAGKDYLADNTFGVEIMKQVITRLDSIMYGVIAAWFLIFKKEQFFQFKNTFFVFGLMLMFVSVAMIHYSHFFHNYLYYSFTAIAVMCLLPKLSSLHTATGKISQGIQFISVISYSMYLSNFMLVQRGLMPVVIKYGHLNPEQHKMHSALCLILFWLFTLMLSYLFYRFWEKPFLNWRLRLLK